MALALVVLCTASTSRAQVDTVRPGAIGTSGATVPSGGVGGASVDSGGFHMSKSPLKAVLLSTVLPGAGQVYLGQAWKLIPIAGLAGGFLYGALIQNHRYMYTIDSINNQYARGDSLTAHRYESIREFYRDDRDKWWIYLGLTYIATLLDAYISANLYDFDVSTPTNGNPKFAPYYDPFQRRFQLDMELHF